MKHYKHTFRLILAAGLVLAPAALALHTTAAHAQQAFRTVNGEVTDKAGTAVKGAVVHLKDTKSMAQRTYITAEDGQYKFAQLSTNTDYEIWAEADGNKTGSKSLSSFDNKNAATVNLKLP